MKPMPAPFSWSEKRSTTAQRSSCVPMTDEQLSHLDETGQARMVDVSAKEPTARRAVARASVEVKPETAHLVARGDAPKGEVLGTARIAGIQAAKRTAELIPLCHPLPLSY